MLVNFFYIGNSSFSRACVAVQKKVVKGNNWKPKPLTVEYLLVPLLKGAMKPKEEIRFI